MCGAKNASAEMRSNVTFVSRMGSFVLDYHGLNVQPPLQHIEIPSSFSGTGRSTNSIAWKRSLLWNKWLLSGREKKNELNE